MLLWRRVSERQRVLVPRLSRSQCGRPLYARDGLRSVSLPNVCRSRRCQEPYSHACARRESDLPCYSTGHPWNDCPHGTFCNVDNVCTPFSAEGLQCSCDDSQPCAPGLVCYVPGTGSGFAGAACNFLGNSAGLVGSCTRKNSLPNGGRFFVVPPFSAVGAGAAVCASGLAVPLPDPAGYASNTSVCVAAWSWSDAGAPCAACVPNAAGSFPLVGDGSLTCQPPAPSGNTDASACTAVPNYAFTAAAIAAQIAFDQCVLSAQSPVGTPCSFYDSSLSSSTTIQPLEGTCAYYACYGAYARALALTAAPNPVSAPYVSTQCQVDNAVAAATYAGNPTIGCSLPAPFAAQGWLCQANAGPPGGGGGGTSGYKGLSHAASIAIAAVAVIIALGAVAAIGICYFRRRRVASTKASAFTQDIGGSEALDSAPSSFAAAPVLFPAASSAYAPPMSSSGSLSGGSAAPYKALLSDTDNPFA
jgi:hypothetical protein